MSNSVVTRAAAIKAVSVFAWRGPSHIADTNPSMRYKPAAKSLKPLVQIVLTNKHNSINTIATLARDKTRKLLKASI